MGQARPRHSGGPKLEQRDRTGSPVRQAAQKQSGHFGNRSRDSWTPLQRKSPGGNRRVARLHLECPLCPHEPPAPAVAASLPAGSAESWARHVWAPDEDHLWRNARLRHSRLLIYRSDYKRSHSTQSAAIDGRTMSGSRTSNRCSFARPAGREEPTSGGASHPPGWARANGIHC